MMSSVIPARLEFQCGHAALVSLPRIKNETSAVRNERVAREKRDALARRCDFCGPMVVAVAHTAPAETKPAALVLSKGSGSNGHHSVTPVTEPETLDTLVSERGTAILETVPATQQTTPATLETVTPSVETAPATLEAATAPLEAPDDAPQAAAESIAPAPTPSPSVDVQAPTDTSPEPASKSVAPRAPQRRVAKQPRLVKRGRPAALDKRAVRPTPPTPTANQYRVRFVVQRVVQAADLLDALRQVESMGAQDVLEISAR